jgi:hypothetical protein
MNAPRCGDCGHPLYVHGNDPRSKGCPADRFHFAFQIGDTIIHETIATVALARPIARSLVSANEGATVRIFKHGPRVPYSWEATSN